MYILLKMITQKDNLNMIIMKNDNCRNIIANIYNDHFLYVYYAIIVEECRL